MVIKISRRDIIIKVSLSYHEKPLQRKTIYFKYKLHDKSEWIDAGEGVTDNDGIVQKILSFEEGEIYDLLIEFKGDNEFAPATKRLDNIYVRPVPYLEVMLIEHEDP
jgi:tryptophanase